MVANDALSSLYAWHAFDIWNSFCQKTIHNVLEFLIVSAKGIEVPAEILEDCQYLYRSVYIEVSII